MLQTKTQEMHTNYYSACTSHLKQMQLPIRENSELNIYILEIVSHLNKTVYCELSKKHCNIKGL